MCVVLCMCVYMYIPWAAFAHFYITSPACKPRSRHLEKMSFSQPFPLFQSPIKPIIAFCQFCQPFPRVRNPVLKTALRHSKTPWQWSTDTQRNRTKKVSNVPSETLLKIAFCQFCQPFPVVLPPVLKTALRHTKTPWQWRTDTPRNRSKKLSNVPSETLLKNSLLPILPTFSRCAESGADNSPPPHQNTMAVKDGHATKSHQKSV